MQTGRPLVVQLKGRDGVPIRTTNRAERTMSKVQVERKIRRKSEQSGICPAACDICPSARLRCRTCDAQRLGTETSLTGNYRFFDGGLLRGACGHGGRARALAAKKP